MRVQSAKAKGRRLQQTVASAICTAFNLHADDVRSTSMGAGGEDVQLSTRARELVPYSFECKNQERLNVWAALDQARANAPSATTPVLVIKRNGVSAQAVLPFDLFVRLIAGPSSAACADDKASAVKALDAATAVLADARRALATSPGS